MPNQHFERAYDVTGEKALWCAVILTGLKDATSNSRCSESERDMSRAFLVARGAATAEMLGVDRDAWRSFVDQMLQNDWAHLGIERVR